MAFARAILADEMLNRRRRNHVFPDHLVEILKNAVRPLFRNQTLLLLAIDHSFYLLEARQTYVEQEVLNARLCFCHLSYFQQDAILACVRSIVAWFDLTVVTWRCRQTICPATVTECRPARGLAVGIKELCQCSRRAIEVHKTRRTSSLTTSQVHRKPRL